MAISLLVVAFMLPLALAADNRNDDAEANKNTGEVLKEVPEVVSNGGLSEQKHYSESQSISDEAHKLINDSKYQDALNILLPEFDKHNNDPQLAILTAQCYGMLGNPAMEKKYLTKASALKPKDKNYNFLRKETECGLNVGWSLMPQSGEHIISESSSLTAYSTAQTFRQGIEEGI